MKYGGTLQGTMRWCLLFILFAGCVTPGPPRPGTVTLRPDGSPGPEPCPKAALDAMELVLLRPGDGAWVNLDVNKVDQHDITVNDGPIESALQEPLGRILDTSTLLYGKVWTSGPDVVIRYYEALPPERGRVIPICGVARLGGGQLKKKPGPAPGSAVLEFSTAQIEIVDAFR